jgi:hypothetical protein
MKIKTENRWNNDDNDDVKKDLVIRDEMRKLFDISCTQSCRLKTLTEIFALLKCFDEFKMKRTQRAKFDINDMFMPVRGRRTKPSPEIFAEKKAKLEMLKNAELFVPNRGRRDYRKKLPHIQLLQPMLIKRNNGIDLNSKDYFMPNRGRRQPAIDAIISEKFFPQRGKKSSSSSTSSSAKVSKKQIFSSVPWHIRNINSDDKIMIDLLQDLNQLVSNDDDDDEEVSLK